MEGRKKTYKPGQLVTIDRRVYRLQKGICVDCPADRLYAISYFGCRHCWLTFHVSRKENSIMKLNLKPIR